MGVGVLREVGGLAYGGRKGSGAGSVRRLMRGC